MKLKPPWELPGWRRLRWFYLVCLISLSLSTAGVVVALLMLTFGAR
jgi:hypothetical protein